MPSTIIGEALPNIPWQDRPAGSVGVVWRHGANPVIDRHPIPVAQAIYNSAVVPFDGAFVGLFRTEYRNRVPHLHVGRSRDGLKWEFEEKPISFSKVPEGLEGFEYQYDPRVTKLDDAYYVTWCNGYHGPTIGIARTTDFRTFEQLENAFLPYNRNGVLFPRKIGGKYAMLSRPSDTGHTPFGDIFYSESPDLTHWGVHRHVMAKGAGGWWESTKIGAGPVPIETRDGWLLFYHGVMTQCNGYVYAMGAALLDRDRPWTVVARCKYHLLAPEEPYETSGFVANVIFPVAALADAPTGRIAVYYGSADTYTALAYCQADELVAYIKSNAL